LLTFRWPSQPRARPAGQFIRLKTDQEAQAIAVGIDGIDTLGDPTTPESDRDAVAVERAPGRLEFKRYVIVRTMLDSRDLTLDVAKNRPAASYFLGDEQEIDAKRHRAHASACPGCVGDLFTGNHDQVVKCNYTAAAIGLLRGQFGKTILKCLAGDGVTGRSRRAARHGYHGAKLWRRAACEGSWDGRCEELLP